MQLSKDVSVALNNMARKITSNSKTSPARFTYKTFNGSCLPFIGPYWQDVDFTADYCHIAFVEVKDKNINKIYVGFNQHIKFLDYPYFTITGEKWEVIKQAFIGLYRELHSERPQVDEVDLWLSKIHDNLYEFSQNAEIIRD